MATDNAAPGLDDLGTVPELAKRLKFPESGIYERVANGEIPHIRIGRLIRFDWQEIAAWIAQQRQGPPAAEAEPPKRPRAKRGA
jgi:excisionase family DNA binding protein